MDIHLTDAAASAEEREAIDALLGAPATRWEGGDRVDLKDGHHSLGGHAARARRHLLLPALHAVRDAVGGVSAGAVNYIAQRLSVPPAEIYGVTTFYALFDTDRDARRPWCTCATTSPATRTGRRRCIRELEAKCGPEGRVKRQRRDLEAQPVPGALRARAGRARAARGQGAPRRHDRAARP